MERMHVTDWLVPNDNENKLAFRNVASWVYFSGWSITLLQEILHMLNHYHRTEFMASQQGIMQNNYS